MAVWKSVGEKCIYGIGMCFKYRRSKRVARPMEEEKKSNKISVETNDDFCLASTASVSKCTCCIRGEFPSKHTRATAATKSHTTLRFSEIWMINFRWRSFCTILSASSRILLKLAKSQWEKHNEKSKEKKERKKAIHVRRDCCCCLYKIETTKLFVSYSFPLVMIDCIKKAFTTIQMNSVSH